MRQPKPWYRKQTKSWYVQINGRKVNLGRDRDAAFEAFHSLMAGQGTAPAPITARQLIERYANWMEAHRAQSTCEVRRPLISAFSGTLPKSLKASSLRPFHVLEWLNPKHSSTTRAVRIRVVKTIWNWAVSMGYLDSNPIAKMPLPTQRVRQDFLPQDRWPELLDAATDQEFRDFLTVMLLTGARTQEMLVFRAEHFDGSRLVLGIEESKGRRRSRAVYLPHEALEIVRKLVQLHPSGALFRNRQGNAWNRNSVRLRFRRLKTLLGMPSLCSTTLRHSYAHNRLTAGQDALTVSKLMGHVDTRMLATRYGHLDADTEYMQRAANGVGSSID